MVLMIEVPLLTMHVSMVNDESASRSDYSAYICYNQSKRKGVSMCQKYTTDELNSMNHDAKNEVIYRIQLRFDKSENTFRKKGFTEEGLADSNKILDCLYLRHPIRPRVQRKYSAITNRGGT